MCIECHFNGCLLILRTAKVNTSKQVVLFLEKVQYMVTIDYKWEIYTLH